jgi:hypothetical protein
MPHNANISRVTKPSLMFDFGQGVLEHITGSAQLHLLFPGSVDSPVTDGAVDEPAQVSGGKFPGRALLTLFQGA